MAVSTNMIDELKNSLMSAENVDKVKAIFKEAGQAISEEDAEHIVAELRRKKTKGELSEDELESVTGGRDWIKEGCAATVEPGSWCWTNDACKLVSVKYSNPPYKRCTACSDGMFYQYSFDGTNRYYRCNKCGKETVTHDMD